MVNIGTCRRTPKTQETFTKISQAIEPLYATETPVNVNEMFLNKATPKQNFSAWSNEQPYLPVPQMQKVQH